LIWTENPGQREIAILGADTLLTLLQDREGSWFQQSSVKYDVRQGGENGHSSGQAGGAGISLLKLSNPCITEEDVFKVQTKGIKKIGWN